MTRHVSPPFLGRRSCQQSAVHHISLHEPGLSSGPRAPQACGALLGWESAFLDRISKPDTDVPRVSLFFFSPYIGLTATSLMLCRDSRPKTCVVPLQHKMAAAPSCLTRPQSEGRTTSPHTLVFPFQQQVSAVV